MERMMDRAAINRREKEKREELVKKAERANQGKTDAGEQEAQVSLLRNWHNDQFPFAIASEWEYEPLLSQFGCGDVVFADRPGVQYSREHEAATILVVEMKHIENPGGKTARARRKHHRNKVVEQMCRSMEAWQKRHPNDVVYGTYFISGFPKFYMRHCDSSQMTSTVQPNEWAEFDCGEFNLHAVKEDAPKKTIVIPILPLEAPKRARSPEKTATDDDQLTDSAERLPMQLHRAEPSRTPELPGTVCEATTLCSCMGCRSAAQLNWTLSAMDSSVERPFKPESVCFGRSSLL